MIGKLFVLAAVFFILWAGTKLLAHIGKLERLREEAKKASKDQKSPRRDDVIDLKEDKKTGEFR